MAIYNGIVQTAAATDLNQMKKKLKKQSPK